MREALGRHKTRSILRKSRQVKMGSLIGELKDVNNSMNARNSKDTSLWYTFDKKKVWNKKSTNLVNSSSWPLKEPSPYQ